MEIKAVTYRQLTKRVGSITVPGFGTIPKSQLTGEFDKSTLDIITDLQNYVVKATHDEIKKKFRRLRDSEAAELDQIEAELSRLREERKAIMQKAWDRGNVVPVKELVEWIPKK